MVKSMSSLPCVVCADPVEVTQPHFRIRRIKPHRLKGRFQKFALRPSHWACYEAWHERGEISEAVVKCFTDDFEYTDGRLLWSNKRVALAVLPDGPEPDCALLAFSRTGTILEIPFAEWDPDRVEDLGPSDRNDLAEIVGELRRHFPTGASLIEGLPWEKMKREAEETRRSVEHDIALYRGQWPEVRPGVAKVAEEVTTTP